MARLRAVSRDGGGAPGLVRDGCVGGREGSPRQRRTGPQGDDCGALCGRRVRGDLRRVGCVREGRRMQGSPRRQGLGTRDAPGHQRELEGCKGLCRVALVGDREGIPVVVGGGVGVRRPGGDARARSTSTVRCRRLGRTTRFSSRTGARPLPLARSRATGSDFTMCTGMPGSGWRTAGMPITEVRLPTGARGRRTATAASVSFAAVPGATDRGFSEPRRASSTHSSSGAATSAFALPAPSRRGEGTHHDRMVRLRGSALACKRANRDVLRFGIQGDGGSCG